MRSNTIVILGSRENETLKEAVFELGHTPLTRDTIARVIEKIRQERVSSIVVDSEHTDPEIDILEFILNVRDIDKTVPVLMAGQPGIEPEDFTFLSSKRIFVLGIVRDPKLLAEKIEDVMMSGPAEDD
jgi:hypothetical protein